MTVQPLRPPEHGPEGVDADAGADPNDPNDPEYPRAARGATSIAQLDAQLIECRACPRLVEWRERVADVKRASFRDDEYWARPVPGFGDERAAVAVVGLAPAAHGANRTGRMFTGDRSGDFLVAALHRCGFANQATSVRADDGLRLVGARLTAPVRCAPPDNHPTPEERRRCSPYLAREIELLGPSVRVAIALGAFGWQALLSSLAEQGWEVPRPRPKFAHGAEVVLRRGNAHTAESAARRDGQTDTRAARPADAARADTARADAGPADAEPATTGSADAGRAGAGPAPAAPVEDDASAHLTVLGCFHVSQQNTFTGRLTPAMLDEVLLRARRLAGLGDPHPLA